jgi:hypothetical protein
MKQLILSILMVFGGINMSFSQDVSPCNFIEVFIDTNTVYSETFVLLSLDLNSFPEWDGMEIDFNWVSVGGNQEYTDNDIIHQLIVPQFDYYETCVDITIPNSPIGTSSCTICNGLYWDGTMWTLGNTSGVVESSITPVKLNVYYNLDGKEFNNFDDIPTGSSYIYNNKKYIKE